MRASIYYEARVAFGWATLLPALLLPAYALIAWLNWSAYRATPQPGELIRAFVLGLPLSAGLAAAHLMVIEREEGFDSLRRSYPESSSRLPVRRALGGIIAVTVSTLVTGVIFHLAYGDYAVETVIIPAVPPALYLMGLALLIGNVTGGHWIPAALVVGYWFMEFETRGAFTKAAFLFNPIMPIPSVDAALNRWLLVGLACLWASLNVGYSSWRRSRGG
ncbi:MAG: hypothetical protein IT319_22750 [Anaerolineae bacterium]|nr:hypothetical protein [Anaerolineae bacterium]